MIPFPVPEAQHARKKYLCHATGHQRNQPRLLSVRHQLGPSAPPDPWRQLRLVVFLNHTSLYEPLFIGGFPPDTMVIIIPEGRMMRANGLDKNSRAMTVRGGGADICRSIPKDLLLLRPGAGISAGLCGLSRINLPAATLVAHFNPFAFRK